MCKEHVSVETVVDSWFSGNFQQHASPVQSKIRMLFFWDLQSNVYLKAILQIEPFIMTPIYIHAAFELRPEYLSVQFK